MAMSQVPDGFSFEELYGAYGVESAVVGIRATDAGIEVRYRSDGQVGTMANRSDWLERMGGLRSSQVAAIMSLPEDLSALTQPAIDAMEETFNAPPEGLDDYTRNQWDYEQALTDEERTEYDELFSQWDEGQLAEDDPDYDRLLDLDDRYWRHGTRSGYDEWIESGNTDEQWRYEQALTHEEFYEFLELEPLFDADELDEDGVNRFHELDDRLYAFGVVSDHPSYEPPVDVLGIVEEVYDLLSGATLTMTLSDLLTEPDFGVSVTLADGPAERILDLPIPDLDQLVEELGDDLVFDGDTVTFGEVHGGDETLAQHPRFDEAFTDMPDRASMALFADVQSINSSASKPVEWLEPISVITMVQDTSGSGVIRILID
jgi:hypothetical protein